MAKKNTLRALSHQIFKKRWQKPVTDLSFELSVEDQYRANMPPTDNSIVDKLHGVKVSDPFRPLEDLTSPGTTAWVQRQNDKFADYISDQQASTDRATEFLTNAMNYDRSSIPARYGQKYFRSEHKAGAKQAVLQMADSADGPWTALLDPNTLDADGKIALSNYSISPDGSRLVYLLSSAGDDAETLHVMETATGKNLTDKIDNCRFTSVLWDKDSSEGFQYTYAAPDDKKRFIVKHHAIGADAATDAVIFEDPAANSFAQPHRLETAQYEWIATTIGTEKNAGLSFRPYGSTDAFTQLIAASTYTLSPIGELEDGTVLAITNKDAPLGKLVKFDPKNFDPATFETIVAESKEDKLDGAFFHQGKIYVCHMHDTADTVSVYTPDGGHVHDLPVPANSIISFGRTNPEDTHFTLRIGGFQAAGDTYDYDTETNTLTLTKASESPIDLKDCIIERIHATSRDGTLVPMTVIRHPDTKLDGTAALKLYGYGGFNVPLTPGFSATIAQFVREGGIYVQANLRGGGEFGEKWYNEGRLKNKQNVFDDFTACARHLIDKDYTSRKRIVINGGSNGGLLTSATLLQHPKLFGAAITEVAVTDMFRFHQSTYGAYWISDYGDPGVKADFNAAARYSPLHNVDKGAKYPPHLIKTGDNDTRVVPWHSYKLAATIQARSKTGNVTLLATSKDAGHGAGKGLDKYIREQAESFAFIEKAIGPVNQEAYKIWFSAKHDADKALAKQAKADRHKKIKKAVKGLFKPL